MGIGKRTRGVNHYLYRLYLSPKVKDSKVEIDSHWSLGDVVEYLRVLDAVDWAEAEARRESKNRR